MIHFKSLLLGASLVAAGFVLGVVAREPQAQAQHVAGGGLFMNGQAPALITSSADGKTVYLWSLGGAHVANPVNRPRLVTSIEAD